MEANYHKYRHQDFEALPPRPVVFAANQEPSKREKRRSISQCLERRKADDQSNHKCLIVGTCAVCAPISSRLSIGPRQQRIPLDIEVRSRPKNKASTSKPVISARTGFFETVTKPGSH